MFGPPYLAVIVDDEEMIVEIIAHYLQAGFGAKLKVEKFVSAEAANEFIANNDVRIVYSDLSMPGFHGMDFTRALVKAERGIQCVVISGDLSYSSAMECFLNGVVGFVVKPIARDAVLEITNRCIAHIQYWDEVIAGTAGV